MSSDSKDQLACLSRQAIAQVMPTVAAAAPVLSDSEQSGRCALGGGASIRVEFASSNLTGPLHAGHGRAAALQCDYNAEQFSFAGDTEWTGAGLAVVAARGIALREGLTLLGVRSPTRM